MLDLPRQRQQAQEVGEVVGQGMELQSDRVVAEGVAGEPGPTQRQLVFLDVLLGGAAAVVEPADPLLQHAIGRQADGVADPLRLQQLVQLAGLANAASPRNQSGRPRAR